MRRLWFTWFLAIVFFIVLGLSLDSRAAQVDAQTCVTLGESVTDVVSLREIGGDVEKHLELLRRLNKGVPEEIFLAFADFVRKGYADDSKPPEDFGMAFTQDCGKRRGHYEPVTGV